MPRATKALLLKRGGKAPKSINEPISNTPPMTVADKGRNSTKKYHRATKALLLMRGEFEQNNNVLFSWSTCITLWETCWQIITQNLTERCDRAMITISIMKVVKYIL